MLRALSALALLPIICAAHRIELLILALTALLTVIIRYSWAIPVIGRWRVALPNGSWPLLALLGFELPLAPALGTSILAGTILIVSFGVARPGPYTVRWIAPLLILLGCSVVGEVLWALPEIPVLFRFFESGMQLAPARMSRATVRQLFDVAIPSLSYLSKVIVFWVAVRIVESSDSDIPVFQKSLAFGVLCASLFTIVQGLDLLPFLPHGQNSFWSSINRVSGTFSDPNAQGIFLAIAPFVLMAERGRTACQRFPRYVWGVLWMLIGMAGLLSGSRTFLIGVMLMLVVCMARFSRRLILGVVAVAVCGIVALSLIDYFTPFVDQVTQLSFVPEGLRRGIKSFSLMRVQESFFSRAVFLAIGNEVFRQAPLLGIGADRFRYYVPAVTESLGLNLGGWVDNSNNFYLGLLAELGIVGFIAFWGCVAGRVVRRPFEPALYGLGILAVLLLTGPHLDFSEVSILAAFCVARGTQAPVLGGVIPRTPVTHGVVLASLALCGLLAPMTREYGAYSWGRHQWLSPRAHLFFSCPCSGAIRVAVEAPHVPREHSLQVRVLQGAQVLSSVTFSGPGTQEVSIPCTRPANTLHPVPRRRRLTIESSVAWSPATINPRQSRDARVFGVRLRHRRASDLVRTEQCRE